MSLGPLVRFFSFIFFIVLTIFYILQVSVYYTGTTAHQHLPLLSPPSLSPSLPPLLPTLSVYTPRRLRRSEKQAQMTQDVSFGPKVCVFHVFRVFYILTNVFLICIGSNCVLKVRDGWVGWRWQKQAQMMSCCLGQRYVFFFFGFLILTNSF